MNTIAAPSHLTKVPVLWPTTSVAAETTLLFDAEAKQQWSYAEIFQLIEFFGDVCRNLNIRNRKPVVTVMVNDRTDQALACLMGLFNLVVINPINCHLHTTEIDHLLANAKPDLILSDDQGVYEGVEKYLSISMATLKNAAIGQASGNNDVTHAALFTARELSGELLIYTSGTTGQAKAVRLSAKNIQHNVQTACRYLGFYPGIRTLSILPLFHSFTVVNDLLTALYCGGSCVIAPVFNTRASAIIADCTNYYRVNSFSGVPMIFEALACFPLKLSDSLKFVVAAAAPLLDAVRLKYQTLHKHTLLPCYYMSEASCFISIPPGGKVKPGSCGKPVGLELRILDQEGDPLKPYARGEIAILGESVIRHYFNNENADNKLFTKEHWLRTGDMGYLDDDGYLFITERKKAMIRNADKHYLINVKQCLLPDILVQDANSFI